MVQVVRTVGRGATAVNWCQAIRIGKIKGGVTDRFQEGMRSWRVEG